MKEHDHICHCGTSSVKSGGHVVGESGCCRKIVSTPIKDGEEYIISGNDRVSTFTLTQQRGYFRHSCGCWSSHGDSVNSLDGDW